MNYYEGFLRDIFLAIDGIHLFISFQLALLFYYRGIRRKKGLRVNFSWGVVFTCFAIVALMNMGLFFYGNQEIWNENIKLFSIIGVIPGLTIVCILESFYQRYHKSRYLFTILGIVTTFITFFTPESITTSISNITLLVIAFFLISFFITIIKGSSGAVRKNAILFTMAFFIFALGDVILNPRVIEVLITTGDDIYLSGIIGRILRISALFLMATVIFEQPVFYELNWRENLIEILVIHKQQGISISDLKFQGDDKPIEVTEEFIAGGITGIAALLKEISQSSKELKTLDHGDQKILLDHGEYIYIVLIVNEELRIFWDKLKKLREEIESNFYSVLGDQIIKLEYFKPLAEMIYKEFS